LAEKNVLARQIAKGIRLHQRGQLADAEKIYGRVLRKDPNNVNALNFLGVLSQQRGDAPRGISLLEKCIQLDPQYADAYQNLVRMLLDQGDYERALLFSEGLISLSPYSAEAFISHGVCNEKLGRYTEARDSLEKGLQLDATHIRARFKLASVLRELGEANAAIEHYRAVLQADPTFEVAYESLGLLLYKQGEIDGMADIYRRWLNEFPGNARAAHLYASCSDVPAPERASDAYVADVFDSFADTFDKSLSDLNYQAPQLVADALDASSRGNSLDILDVGCGTGLCGPLIYQFAARLVGVDLSSRMLEKAKLLDIYDELHKMELVSFMRSTAENFDCVISADTLVYFGDVQPVFAAVVEVLNPGGEFIFTVEMLEASSGQEYRLNPHGRYSHSSLYIDRSIIISGLKLERIDEVVFRKEGDQDVIGLLIIAHKPAN